MRKNEMKRETKGIVSKEVVSVRNDNFCSKMYDFFVEHKSCNSNMLLTFFTQSFGLEKCDYEALLEYFKLSYENSEIEECELDDFLYSYLAEHEITLPMNVFLYYLEKVIHLRKLDLSISNCYERKVLVNGTSIRLEPESKKDGLVFGFGNTYDGLYLGNITFYNIVYNFCFMDGYDIFDSKTLENEKMYYLQVSDIIYPIAIHTVDIDFKEIVKKSIDKRSLFVDFETDVPF